MADGKAKGTNNVVAKGSRVSVEYTGTFDDGTVFDTTDGRSPIAFVTGNGEVIRGFDDAVIGMKKGEQKTIKITPQDGYGERDERLLQQVPRSVFPAEMKLDRNMGFSFRAPQGQMMHATITGVSSDTVTLDMNHPLAGKNLVFKLKVVDINQPERS
ncbi:peptidylprolyl isomerase [Candidatus Woesearchaeota archaeon]|nr:peptidylprolyl isomerase [Candidatus Woesearchaeota archaeon]